MEESFWIFGAGKGFEPRQSVKTNVDFNQPASGPKGLSLMAHLRKMFNTENLNRL